MVDLLLRVNLLELLRVTSPPRLRWQPKLWPDEPSVQQMLLFLRHQARLLQRWWKQRHPNRSRFRVLLCATMSTIWLGPDYSAAVVANLMAHTLNETDLMSAAGFLTLPFQLRPDPLVWRVLHAENVAALARGRKPFSYVDLTAKELLPLWLAPDTIGGKTPAGADWGAVLDPNAPASNPGTAWPSPTRCHSIKEVLSYPLSVASSFQQILCCSDLPQADQLGR